MKRLIAAVALAAFFVLGDGKPGFTQAQFNVLKPKICQPVEANLSRYLMMRHGEFQEEILEGNHDGQNVVWMLFRNKHNQSWTLATFGNATECIIAHGVGEADKGIAYFVERAAALQGTAL